MKRILLALALLCAALVPVASAGPLGYYREPWTAYDLGSGVAAWWSAEDYTRMVDDGAGVISSWKDRKTQLAVTAATTQRPTWGASSFNTTYPGITFDGVLNGLTTTTLTQLPTGSTPSTICMVLQITSPGVTAGRFLQYGGTSGGVHRRLYQSTAGRPSISDGNANVIHPSQVFTPLVLCGDWSGTTENAYLNGTAITGSPTTTVTLNTGITRFRIGGDNNAATPANTSAMVLAEVVITNTLLGTSDRQKLEGYLHWKWGLVSLLPASHPYKGAPP